jgi:Cu/Ag efflux protein CusF
MKSNLARFSVLLAVAPVIFVCATSPIHAATPAEAAKRHPLKGVVTAVDPEQSSLRVKHEEIPGVMRAMTMMFKVDAATLKSVKTGDAITALLSREGGEWRLHEVKVVAGKKT